MLSGAAWMVAMRWAVRGIGLVSTVILVRLLAPDDFGLLAMSYLVISFLEVLTSFGVDIALIQKTEKGKDLWNTAWTIKVVQISTVACLILVTAPFAADHFEEPRIVPLMAFLSFGIFVSAFGNIGIVAFRKDLQFNKEFLYQVVTKVGGFVVTIPLAFLLRSYWALAWGIVAGHFVAVGASYALHPYRPRLSLERFKDLWSFSQWMLLRNIGMYLRRRVDGFLVASFFNTNQMGYYGLGTEVSQLPTTELIWPMSRAFFPGYAKIADDPGRLASAYLRILNGVALMAIPAGVGLALVARPLVFVAFGETWAPVVPVLRWLSIYGVILTVSSGVQTPLVALGRMPRVTALVWTQTLIALSIIAFVATLGSLELIALAQVGSALLLLPLFFYSITSIRLVTWADLRAAVWRPVVAALAMAGALLVLPTSWIPLDAIELAIKVPLGALVYVGVDLGLWRLAGRPDGGEQLLHELISKRFKRDQGTP
jgi:O-antigen/teichoic acid export membrane protein